MQLERRRPIRRALAGGVILSALSVLPVGVIEALYVFLVRAPSFYSVGEAIRFVVYLFLLLIFVGAIFGLFEGAAVLGVSLLAKSIAKQRLKEPNWMALFYSLICSPGIAAMAALTFSGRRAQQIPGKHLIALGLGIAGLVATYGLFRAIIWVRDRFRIRRWGPRRAALLAPALLLLAVAFYLLDQRFLARLYLWFHAGIAVLTVACCQMAAGTIYAAFRPTARWMGRLAEPSVALMFLIAAVAGGAFSLNRIGRWESLRYISYEHTAVHSKLLALANGVGLKLSTPPPEAPVPKEAPTPKDALLPGPRLERANLVLLSVDALRADHLGTYGYRRKTSPHIDRWARRATVFEHGYCQVPHTSFSVTSLMTGTYLYSATLVDPGRRFRTVAEVLRRYGFKTAGFFPPSVFYIDRDKFTAFERSRYGFEYVKYQYAEAAERVDQILTFLRQAPAGHPVFVWAHFFEPHEPYDKHEGFDFGPRAEDRYDSEIAYVDHHLGRLLDHLRRHRPNTVVALTADHGEEFGEHGAHYHGNALYEQQVRVPLIISVPEGKGRRVDGAAQVIDLPVTLLSLVDVPLSARMRGTDLGPWLAGEKPSRLPPVFSEMERKKMVVYKGHKLICDTARNFCELYNLAKDPGERRNEIVRRSRLAARLRKRLHAWMASHSRSAEEDEENEVAMLLNRGRQKDPGAIPGLLELCKGELEVRREAVRLLSLMRHPSAREALVRAAADADPGVRLQAIVGSALLGYEKSIAGLARVLARPDLPPQLRRDALLARAIAGDRRATKPLCRYLSTTEEIYERKEIIEVLGRLGDPAAGPALRAQLSTLRTKLLAIQALGLVRDRQVVPTLVRSVRQDRFISWRRAAARSLGYIGDPRARPALEGAVLHDLEPDVVGEALTALARLRALPAPGVTTLRSGPWTCADGACRLDLGQVCTRDGRGKDLLLLLRVPKERRFLADPQRSTSTKRSEPVPGWRVLCGEALIGTVQPQDSDASVLFLRGGLPGPLRLESGGAPPPPLVYAGLRVTPAKR